MSLFCARAASTGRKDGDGEVEIRGHDLQGCEEASLQDVSALSLSLSLALYGGARTRVKCTCVWCVRCVYFSTNSSAMSGKICHATQPTEPPG